MRSIQETLTSTIDRMNEAHFWLHSMEDCYHHADQFRWCFNAFLRTFKEIPQIITMELQTNLAAAEWFKNHKKIINDDPLIKILSKNRDFVVHRAMLLPESSGTIGLSDGSRIRFGLKYKIDPLMDSDRAMHDFLLKSEDVFGILGEDDDTIPCIERFWKIKQFDIELVNLCASAWIKMSDVTRDAVQELGGVVSSQDLNCHRGRNNYCVKLYSRKILKEMISNH